MTTAIYIQSGEIVTLTNITRDLYGEEEIKVVFPNGETRFEFFSELQF